MNQTGWAYLPGTFPTSDVLNAVKEALPASAGQWSRTKINDLYFLYKQGVNEGLPIVRPGEFETKDYIMKNSSYSENDVRVFLVTLYLLSQKGDIESKWWNIPLQKEQGLIPSISDMAEDLDKWAGTIKWGSIALIFAGTLYLTWPYIKALRARRKQHGT